MLAWERPPRLTSMVADVTCLPIGADLVGHLLPVSSRASIRIPFSLRSDRKPTTHQRQGLIGEAKKAIEPSFPCGGHRGDAYQEGLAIGAHPLAMGLMTAASHGFTLQPGLDNQAGCPIDGTD